MGFQSFFQSMSNAYSGIKAQVSNIYHKGKDILHQARGGVEWFDNALNSLSSIPFLNTLVQEGKSLLQFDLIKSTIQDMDSIAQSGDLESYGGMIDQFITGGLQAGETIGGVADQFFGGGSSAPNSSVAGSSVSSGRQSMTMS